MISTLALSAIGVTISLIGLGVSILAFRYARAKHIAGEPYVIAKRNNATMPSAVYWGISGPGSDDWEAAIVKCSDPTAFVRSEWRDNGYAGGLYPVEPPIRTREEVEPANPLFVVESDRDTLLSFELRSKANPKLRLRRRVSVPKI